MKKRFKLLKSKKGVSLVELIVVMAVASILFGIAMGIVQPVTALINSLKSNANMDTVSDVANEYIRTCLEKSVAISAVAYQDNKLDEIKNTWKTYTDTYTKANGYSVRALGILGSYPGDTRLYDFGEVNVIDYKWGEGDFHLQSAKDGAAPGTAFVTLIRDRDGGPGVAGIGHHNFHKFDAFNDAFYANGMADSTNYSFEVAFEIEDKEISSGSSTVTGISRITLYSQMFKRTTEKVKDADGKEVSKSTYEPANQARSVSFNLLNGFAELDVSHDVNSVETAADGTKQIVVKTDAWGGRDGLVILYVVRDIDAVLGGAYIPSNPSDTPKFEVSGGNIYGGYYNGAWNTSWFGINDDKPSTTSLVIKNNSGSSIDTKNVVIEFTGDFVPEVKKLSLSATGNANISNAETIPWPINEQKGNTFKVTLGNWYHDEENDKWEIRGKTWKDGETLTIGKMEIKGQDDSGINVSPLLTSHGKITVYVNGKVVWSKTVKKSS